MFKISEYLKKGKRPVIYYLSLALLTLVFLAIISALISIYTPDIISFYGLPFALGTFLFGVFSLTFGIILWRITKAMRKKRKK